MNAKENVNWIEAARRVIAMEAQAVSGLESVLGPSFERAIRLMLDCKGRVVVTGMGKAGHVARKVAATLASTGTPSFFLHPSEGIHGDLGMITGEDLAVAFSHKGQTEEVLRIIPYLKHIGAPLISITSNPESELAKHSDVSLVLNVPREACPLNLAPTASTTAMLALGDTLAMVLLEARGFAPEDFALFHPGGSLGRRLLTKVGDLMHTGSDNPVVHLDAPLKDAVLVMTQTKMAATSVVDDDGRLVGVLVDGDLRRCLLSGPIDMNVRIRDLLGRRANFARPDMVSSGPKFVRSDTLAVKALEILREYKIIELPVCDENHKPIGMIHLHDITRAGIT